jgi:Cu+-exporting ATPase
LSGTRGSERRELITIPVTGMSCASCVARVEKALSKTEGVSEASANFAAEKVTVAYNPDSASPERLIRTIEDTGYGTEVGQTTLGIAGMTCASCAGRVEKALKKVPGVLNANVNLANEKATVKYLVGEARLRDLERAVEEAG